MLVSDSTTFTNSFLPKYSLTALTVNNQSLLSSWVVGTSSYVYNVRKATDDYYFLVSYPADSEPTVYTKVEVLFLDTTAETITVKSSTVVKTSSVKDVIDSLEDYFAVVV